METIFFKDLLDWCSQLKDKHLTQKEFEEKINTLQIRTYIPMSEKQAILEILANRMTFGGAGSELELCRIARDKLFFIGMSYFENVIIEDQDKELMEYDGNYVYDLISCYVVPYIYPFIKIDYKNFTSMVDQFKQQDILLQLVGALQHVDQVSLSENTQQTQDMLKEFSENQGLFEDLVDLAKFNNPTMNILIQNEIRNNLKKEATKSE